MFYNQEDTDTPSEETETPEEEETESAPEGLG